MSDDLELQRHQVGQDQCKLVLPDPVKGGPAGSANRFFTTRGEKRLGAVSRRAAEVKRSCAAVMTWRMSSHAQLAGARRSRVWAQKAGARRWKARLRTTTPSMGEAKRQLRRGDFASLLKEGRVVAATRKV
ncbi:hypothetical protein MTO96_040565 [Rhipicephalus appendiculatus]